MRPWSHAVPRSALTFALLLGVLLAAGGPPASASDAAQSSGQPVEMTVSVQSDGDATWNVTTTVPLESESDREAFQDAAASFRRGEGPGPSADVFRRAAAAASRETGREMRIRGVNRTAVAGNATGRFTLRFTWTNFARTPGDRVVVGDAFNTTNGTWLPGLTAGQTLVVEPPSGYSVESGPTGPRSGTFRWEGPVTFDPGYLSMSYERSGQVGSPEPPGFDLSLLPLVGVGLVVVGILAAAGYLWQRRESTVGPVATEANGGASDDSATAGATSADAADEGAAAGVDEELLSDEERVERLLEQNGGRMKQADIVAETGWSNAKVSQLLSSMAEEDRVDKLRIGRENLISLPEENVADFE